MAVLSRWNPLKPLSRIETTDFDDLFRSFGPRPMFKDVELTPEIRIDVTENDDAYDISADVPGVRKEDIDIAVDGKKKNGDRAVHSEQKPARPCRAQRGKRHSVALRRF